MRVHTLAKELNVPSKVIIEKCRAEGIDSVKNHMSTLSAGLHATIREWFSEGAHETTVETADPVDLQKVKLKRPRRKKVVSETGADDRDGAEADAVSTQTAVAEPPVTERPARTAAAAGEEEEQPQEVDADAAVEAPSAGAAAAAAEAPAAADTAAEAAEEAIAAEPSETEAGAAAAEAGEAQELAEGDRAVAETSAEGVEGATEPEEVKPAGPQNVPSKAKLQGPRVVRYEAPEYDYVGPRRPRSRSAPAPGPEAAPGGPPPATDKPGRRKGRINPRRAGGGRTAEPGERVSEWRDRDLEERRERLAGATGRRIRRRASQGPTGAPTKPQRKTQATVTEPVHMKDFCAATGLNFMECFKVLRDEHNIMGNVNMTLPNETAELLALHFGIELTVVPAKTKLDELTEEVAARERETLQPRPPVVAMLGHVDHGKTSLLDAIRATDVVADEDGGITQHIGAYHIKTEKGPVTFIDTPGHEAFTAMRARGAQLTDVVVLVVAADDGVMPQTLEAINHAKAAGVPIVVALNKYDVAGEQNKVKIYGQLSEHGLTPSGDWGGETDVLPTVATTGQGVKELVEHLAELSSLLELKADPTLPAAGAVIEAETKPGVGAVARVLVKEGTLRVGDFVVCGPAFGKVRALVDDRDRKISEAGPAIPVEVWGLDDVPSSGDKLYAVSSVQRAKDIAAEVKHGRMEETRIQSRRVNTLEEMMKRRDLAEVPELNIVIKADVDGSVAALKQALAEIPSDEVKLTIRHAGVGGITDSDVLLAAACDGLVIAFRVDAPVAVRRIAEQHGVEIRPYRVIYDAVDDIKRALEGLLAPEERFESRGMAEVREVFRMSKKIGVVAGCYVKDGVIQRNHLAKVIRDGVVVREGSKIGSLRRFKDDTREVRAGLECGIKLENFDDVKAGDVIETYEVIQVARTL